MKNTSKNLIIAAGTNCLILWELWFWPRKHVLSKKDYNVMVNGQKVDFDDILKNGGPASLLYFVIRY